VPKRTAEVAAQLDAQVAEWGGDRTIHSVLVANNGLAATKFIRSVRSWAYKNFGNERAGEREHQCLLACLVRLAAPPPADVIGRQPACRLHYMQLLLWRSAECRCPGARALTRPPLPCRRSQLTRRLLPPTCCAAVNLIAMATPEDMKADAEHIRMADQFVEVPGGKNTNNYANVQLITAVALRTGVDAVWPGW
jgi:hypothetical protein